MFGYGNEKRFSDSKLDSEQWNYIVVDYKLGDINVYVKDSLVGSQKKWYTVQRVEYAVFNRGLD